LPVSDAPVIISTSVAALSALAAWRSSFVASASVARSNLPYVWPVVSSARDADAIVVRVRLHNDGPGLAQDVVAARLEPSGRDDDGGPWTVFARTPVIRGLRGGETLPPPGPRDDSASGWMTLGTHGAGDDVWSVAVRWTDTAGHRWELVVPQNSTDLTRRPAKLRRSWWDRWRDERDW
jgi:hypothetical protein